MKRRQFMDKDVNTNVANEEYEKIMIKGEN